METEGEMARPSRESFTYCPICGTPGHSIELQRDTSNGQPERRRLVCPGCQMASPWFQDFVDGPPSEALKKLYAWWNVRPRARYGAGLSNLIEDIRAAFRLAERRLEGKKLYANLLKRFAGAEESAIAILQAARASRDPLVISKVLPRKQGSEQHDPEGVHSGTGVSV